MILAKTFFFKWRRTFLNENKLCKRKKKMKKLMGKTGVIENTERKYENRYNKKMLNEEEIQLITKLE